MQLLEHLILGIIVSFIASIPVGPINVAVVQRTLNKGLRYGIMTGFGGALIEWMYCLMAILGLHLFFEDSGLLTGLQIASIPVLLGLGIYTLRKKETEQAIDSKALKEGYWGSWWSGFSLGMLNPMLIPFWLAISSYLKGAGFLEQTIESQVFAIGVFAGTLLLFYTVAVLSAKRNISLTQEMRLKINKVIGWIFMGMGGWQLVWFIIRQTGVSVHF